MKTLHLLVFSLIFLTSYADESEGSYQPPAYFDDQPKDDADYYYDIGIDYLVQGKYTLALESFYKSYEKGVKIEGKDGLYNSETLMQIGYLEAKLMKYHKAEESLLEAIRISVLHLGRDVVEQAQLYNILGWIKSLQGDYNEAFKAFRQAFKLQDCSKNENQDVCATIYLNLASAYFENNQFVEAHDYNLKALNIYLSLYGDQDVRAAKAWLELGEASQYLEKIDQAIKCFTEAERILTKVFATQEHPDLGNLYNTYAQVFCATQDFEKCQQYLEKALKIFLKFYGEEDMNVALIYANLANTYHARDKMEDALTYYTLAENMYMKHPDAADDVNVAALYKNLGYYFFDTKSYDKALMAFNKSEAIYLKSKGEKYQPVGYLKFNTGLALKKLNKFSEAYPILEEALAIYKLNLNADDLDISQVYEALADCKYELGDYKKSLEHLKAAFEIVKKGTKEIDYTRGKFIYKLGLTHYHLDNTEVGLEYMQKAYDMFTKIDKKAAADIDLTIRRFKGETPTMINQNEL